MDFSRIEHYAGRWIDDEGRMLVIETNGVQSALVSILVDGAPMARPWCGGKPATALSAACYEVNGPELQIHLGRPGFSLHVNYELADSMNPDEPESLSVAVSTYESDQDALNLVRLFGKLGRYRRADAEGVTSRDQ